MTSGCALRSGRLVWSLSPEGRERKQVPSKDRHYICLFSYRAVFVARNPIVWTVVLLIYSLVC